MNDNTSIWLPDAKKTAFCGASLAESLYALPLDLWLRGELGAGKTTFLQGFALGLGIVERLTSPTFALEQRYAVAQPHHLEGLREFLHLDLYRLDALGARELIEGTEDHPGIRAIEWSERLEEDDGPHKTRDLLSPPPFKGEGKGEGSQKSELLCPTIDIHLAEADSGRMLTVEYRDIPLPSREEILAWRKEVELPEHIADHCDAVGALSEEYAGVLLKRGILCRLMMLRRAGEVHDLLRFIDSRDGAAPQYALNRYPDSQLGIFAKWKAAFPGLRHEAACAAFLRERGFAALADVVAVHGLHLPSPERQTIEQKILFYADKRLNVTTNVSLDERFADFRKRYGSGRESEESNIWHEEAKRVERELFPEGVPF